MTNDIDLYFWPTPNGWKISIALEEMGLGYKTHLVNIGKGDQFDPAFLKISPNNKMPAIVDGEIAVFESGAILLYLARKTRRFYGQTAQEQLDIEQWLMWQMGGLGPMAGQAHHFLKYAPKMEPPQDIPYAKDRYRNEVARLYGVLDRQLAGKDFVCGDLSIADFAIWPWAHLWEGQQHDLDATPNMAAWLDRMAARDGVARGRALYAELRDGGGGTKESRKVLFGRG